MAWPFWDGVQLAVNLGTNFDGGYGSRVLYRMPGKRRRRTMPVQRRTQPEVPTSTTSSTWPCGAWPRSARTSWSSRERPRWGSGLFLRGVFQRKGGRSVGVYRGRVWSWMVKQWLSVHGLVHFVHVHTHWPVLHLWISISIVSFSLFGTYGYQMKWIPCKWVSEICTCCDVHAENLFLFFFNSVLCPHFRVK